jgi:hypothetical protein
LHLRVPCRAARLEGGNDLVERLCTAEAVCDVGGIV